MHNSRLDGFAKLMSSVDPSDVEKAGYFGRLENASEGGDGEFTEVDGIGLGC
jgi:hypothetical protein